MLLNPFNQHNIHTSWQTTIEEALVSLSEDYQYYLIHNSDWLPGAANLFNAFSLPLDKVNYILLGESPYPRAQSANGYAFWDNAVDTLWSKTGLSKPVNRATSLRNWIKMLLLAENALQPNALSQEAIAHLNKTPFVTTITELFHNFLSAGFLLLNATPVLSPRESVTQAARRWRPFLNTILDVLAQSSTPPQLLLFGNIAKQLANSKHIQRFPCLIAPHPYNLTFIHHDNVLALFRPLRLICKTD